jgi:acylphosphatase
MPKRLHVIVSGRVQGPALARVDRVAADEAPGSGEWDTFTIRYD